MTVQALSWAFRLVLLDMAAKVALLALADHADEHGRCWPSVARIALFAGCDERTARRALRRLAELGIITRQSRAGHSDVYTINFAWTPDNLTTLKNESGQFDPGHPDRGPRSDCPPSPDTLTGDPGQSDPLTTKNPHRTPKVTPNEEQRVKLPRDWRAADDDRDHAARKGVDAEAAERSFVDWFGGGKGRNEQRTIAGWSHRFKVWIDTDAKRQSSAPGRAQGLRPARGNDAFYEQLALMSDQDPGNEGNSSE